MKLKKIITKVLDHNKDFAKAIDTLGFILLKQKKYDKAKEYFLEAAEKDPTPAKYKHLADACEGKGESDEARKYREIQAELRGRDVKI